MKHAASNYYSNNEDKFGFLVFDSKKVDSFFRHYNQLEPQSKELVNAFEKLSEASGMEIDTNSEKKYAKHTDKPDSSDFVLAISLLKAAKDSSAEYFFPNLVHLFFFQCLPNEFRYKWVQDVSGDFEFNVTFFNLLRTTCKTFEDHVYGSQGFWDENLGKVFGEFFINEITAQKAKDITACINQTESFSDGRLHADKEHFLAFLHNVIAGKWRLFLYDKN